MASYAFLGTWEIISPELINGANSENSGLEGVRFRLDETGDITWTIPDEFDDNPLFACDTYEIDNNSILRFGACAGHVIEFRVYKNDIKFDVDNFQDVLQSNPKEPRDLLVLKCDNWCILQCKRINDETIEENVCTSFTLLPALEDGYFSDVELVSANNKHFSVHSYILQLYGDDINWKSQPSPFHGSSEDVLGVILHFMYAECLPNAINRVTAEQVITAVSPYPCLAKLVDLCKLYLKIETLKQKIVDLVDDMHSSIKQIIEHFNIRNAYSSTDSITLIAEKLCFIVKQTVRDTAVVVVKLLLLCDTFTKHRNELPKEERNEIIRHAKSHLPTFLSQFQQFLHVMKLTFCSLSPSQRRDVATYLVPEVEILLDILYVLMMEIDQSLQQMLLITPSSDTSQFNSSGSLLGKSLKNIIILRDRNKLKDIQEQISLSLDLLLQKKQNFNEMNFHQRIAIISQNLESLIEELPVILLHLNDFMSGLEEKVVWKDFKFCFKIATSEVSGLLQQLMSHHEKLQSVMLHISELVQREAFTSALYSLGLLGNSSNHSEECLKCSSSTTTSIKTKQEINTVESLCAPPPTVKSKLSQLCLGLFKSGVGSDMEFEVITSNGDQEDGQICEVRHCKIRAHRAIVAARCDWFRRALLSGMKEDIEKKIIIHDSSPIIFTVFLEYLYTGVVQRSSLSAEQCAELLLLSDRYEVDSLKQFCEYSLQSHIDLDSVLYFLSMADQFNARILRSACLKFISQHHEIMETEVYSELPTALQTEILDYAWTQPPPIKSTNTESFLPTSSAPAGVDSSFSDIRKKVTDMHISPKHRSSNSFEDLPLGHDSGRLEDCLSELRAIVGDRASRKRLIEIVLAADYDLCRAINFFYTKHDDIDDDEFEDDD